MGSPQSTTRVTPSGCSGVGVVTTAAMMPALLRPRGRSTGTRSAGVVEVVLDERAAGAGQHGRELVGVDEAAAAGPEHLGGVVVERAEQLGRRRLDRRDDARAGLGAEAHRHGTGSPPATATRPWASTSSMPAPSVSGPDLVAERGQTAERRSRRPARRAPRRGSCRAWRPRRRGPPGPAGSPRGSSPPRARRAAAPVTAPVLVADDGRAGAPAPAPRAAGRRGSRGRRTRRAARPRAPRSRVTSKLRSRHRFRRRPTIGCTPRVRSSSATSPSRGGPEGVVADRPVAAGADGDGDPAYVVGERQRARRSGRSRSLASSADSGASGQCR